MDILIERKMAESNAQTSVTLSGKQWKAICYIINDYKPGRDRNKGWNASVAESCLGEIARAVELTNADIAQDFAN